MEDRKSIKMIYANGRVIEFYYTNEKDYEECLELARSLSHTDKNNTASLSYGHYRD